MKRNLLILVLCPLVFLGCYQKEQQVSIPQTQKEKVVTKTVTKEKVKVVTRIEVKDLQIIGQAEHVYLPSSKIKLKARIDTGATTTSINALNIKQYERDGKKWVKFDLLDENKKVYTKKLPLYEIVSIKRHGAPDQKRPVVKMRINLGNSSKLIRVSLTDRTKFTYPVLIGRNFLNGDSVVDVARQYSIEPIRQSK